MRYPPDQRAKTRARILSAAADLLRGRGIDGTGIDQVMAAAGLTPGGFYTHFRSKEALIESAILAAAEKARLRWYEPLDHLRGRAWASRLIRTYLSQAHTDDRAGGCILPSLAVDVARATPASRRQFSRRLRGLFDHVAERIAQDAPAERSAIISAIALCVGGVVLARAVPERRFAREILSASRAGAAELLGLGRAASSERARKPK